MGSAPILLPADKACSPYSLGGMLLSSHPARPPLLRLELAKFVKLSYDPTSSIRSRPPVNVPNLHPSLPDASPVATAAPAPRPTQVATPCDFHRPLDLNPPECVTGISDQPPRDPSIGRLNSRFATQSSTEHFDFKKGQVQRCGHYYPSLTLLSHHNNGGHSVGILRRGESMPLLFQRKIKQATNSQRGLQWTHRPRVIYRRFR